MKKKLFNLLRIFISLAFLSLLIYRNKGNFSAILDTLKNIDIQLLVIALILYSAGISFIVLRWGILLAAHGYQIFKPFLWQSAFIGWFYNMLLPTGGHVEKYIVSFFQFISQFSCSRPNITIGKFLKKRLVKGMCGIASFTTG